MSIKVMTQIWEESLEKGSALLLLLAIADHAHDDGTGAYPSIQKLAEKSRMTTRNVQLLLRRLEADGELAIFPNEGPHGVNLYEIPFRGENFSGVKADVLAGEIQGNILAKRISPKPSRNHQRIIPKEELLDVDENFRQKMRTKYGGILQDIDDRIDEALGHVSAKKYPNKQLHVQGWLRRDAEKLRALGSTNGTFKQNTQTDAGGESLGTSSRPAKPDKYAKYAGVKFEPVIPHSSAKAS